jgi:hypothetical protein
MLALARVSHQVSVPTRAPQPLGAVGLVCCWGQVALVDAHTRHGHRQAERQAWHGCPQARGYARALGIEDAREGQEEEEE